MSEAPAHPDAPARARLIEVRLHALSPFSPLVNAALIFAALYALYILIAIQTGQSVIEIGPGGHAAFSSGAWIALVLSLVFSAAATMPALSERQWRASQEAVAQTLDEPGARLARTMSDGPVRSRATGAIIALLGGAAGGVGFNIWLMGVEQMSLEAYVSSTGLWFLLVSPPLFGLGARAAWLLHGDERDMAVLVTDHLAVSPARFDRLEVYGQLALRSALTWLVMAGIVMLFFVNLAPIIVSVGALVLTLLASIYAFASTITPVVRAAAAIRDRALSQTRAELETEARSALGATGTPGRLADLAAYEAWLDKRPVWPVSAPVTRRLAVYGLIPALAWFGAATAELVVNALA